MTAASAPGDAEYDTVLDGLFLPIAQTHRPARAPVC